MFKKKNEYINVIPYIMPLLDTLKEEVIVKEDVIVDKEKRETEIEGILNLNKIQDLEREAYERGYESGQKAGFEVGEQRALLLIERLQKAISEISALYNKELKILEKQVLELSVAMAKKIILKELSLNQDAIVNIIKEALMKMQRTGQIRIRIHPSLQEILSKNKFELINVAPDIIFEVDTQLPLYGALVIGSDESISTTIEEQLNNILDDIGLEIDKD